MTRNDPVLAEKVCLALVAEGPTHGWAVSAVLAPDGEIGRIWSLTRPLTYRALDQLVIDGLVEKTGTAPGGGRSRTLLEATDLGHASNALWINEPVALPKDVRTELLVKFALRGRVGEAFEPLAQKQRALFAPLIDDVAPARDPDFVALWRREHLLAIDRFLSSIGQNN